MVWRTCLSGKRNFQVFGFDELDVLTLGYSLLMTYNRGEEDNWFPL
jgi:hypothetical protein